MNSGSWEILGLAGKMEGEPGSRKVLKNETGAGYTCPREEFTVLWCHMGAGGFSPPFVTCSEISACYNGILDPVGLQDNYSYVIER